MFSHVMIGADDIPAAKKFYDACFAALGAREGMIDPGGRLMYIHNGNIFMVTNPIDGGQASCGNGFTLGFAAESEEQANAWHEAGLANGGTAIEDPPGIREGAGMKLYLAYLRDPAGNKVCSMYRPG